MPDETIAGLQSRIRHGKSVTFQVKIIPKSKKSELAGMYGKDILKIKIAAVPAKNKANEELIEYLSDLLDVSKQSISIKKGALSPFKTIEVNP